MTQKSKIYDYLKANPRWFKSYELQAMALQFGASPATVDRRLRDLAKAGGVERRRVGKYEEYRIRQVVAYGNTKVAEVENTKLFEVPVKKSYVN